MMLTPPSRELRARFGGDPEVYGRTISVSTLGCSEATRLR
jgi:hypothetical protein